MSEESSNHLKKKKKFNPNFKFFLVFETNYKSLHIFVCNMRRIVLKQKAEVQTYFAFWQNQELSEENKQTQTVETQSALPPESCELHNKTTGVSFKPFVFSYYNFNILILTQVAISGFVVFLFLWQNVVRRVTKFLNSLSCECTCTHICTHIILLVFYGIQRKNYG